MWWKWLDTPHCECGPYGFESHHAPQNTLNQEKQMLTKDIVWFQAYLANIAANIPHGDAVVNANQAAERWETLHKAK